MDLPVRMHAPGSGELVISVDGAWDAPGLNLSHWPGHATPAELRHDLSTGCALRFAELPDARRRALAAGCVAIENNHFDTDGTCALFAVRHPELALARRARLLAAAEAGDFFRFPDEHAFALDAIVGNVADPERSPWRERFAGLADEERTELATRALLEELPAMLDGELARFAPLFEPELAAAKADVADLRGAAQDEVVHLDLCIWTARPDACSSRAGAPRFFDPGRHALFGTSGAGLGTDRILVVGPSRAGTTYRFLLSTVSWFDLVTRSALPRPDLAALRARLDEIEGTRPADELAWRAQPVDGPSPELWFGRADHERFAEHAPVLRPSRLAPALVRRELIDALRAPLVEA